MNELTEATTDFLKVISDPIRLEIIKLLKNGKKTSKDIEAALEISQSHASTQLNQLQNAGIIYFVREDGIKTYDIKSRTIFKVISTINSYVIQHHKEKIQRLITHSNHEILK